ncbi:hypothetical protein EJ08DRAFT_165141 [Tothia fuscella]|uniref:Uncharacterized protein n=1 Tax=Tothia fuscella TaxID=1048955 RepID=A0A9P4NUA9_9PEZI|nr:hypothetical protein EJ08DRAFT_165141 [Tothia fuscella]
MDSKFIRPIYFWGNGDRRYHTTMHSNLIPKPFRKMVRSIKLLPMMVQPRSVRKASASSTTSNDDATATSDHTDDEDRESALGADTFTAWCHQTDTTTGNSSGSKHTRIASDNIFIEHTVADTSNDSETSSALNDTCTATKGPMDDEGKDHTFLADFGFLRDSIAVGRSQSPTKTSCTSSSSSEGAPSPFTSLLGNSSPLSRAPMLPALCLSTPIILSPHPPEEVITSRNSGRVRFKRPCEERPQHNPVPMPGPRPVKTRSINHELNPDLRSTCSSSTSTADKENQPRKKSDGQQQKVYTRIRRPLATQTKNEIPWGTRAAPSFNSRMRFPGRESKERLRRKDETAQFGQSDHMSYPKADLKRLEQLLEEIKPDNDRVEHSGFPLPVSEYNHTKDLIDGFRERCVQLLGMPRNDRRSWYEEELQLVKKILK